jgi:ribose 5-phosphate isomerase A
MARNADISGGASDPGVQAAALAAVALIDDGARVGLGSGRAASAFIAALGRRVRDGLQVQGVATSRASADLAERAGIALIALAEGVRLDITVDGADEVAPNLDLVKGWGGALVRERIVASASIRQVILVGEEKLVPALGTRGRIPVEVIPLAAGPAMGTMRELGLVPTVRTAAGAAAPLLTENGNVTIDCAPPEPLDAVAAHDLQRALRAITGVVDTGLFLGTAERVIVGYGDGRVDLLPQGDA